MTLNNASVASSRMPGKGKVPTAINQYLITDITDPRCCHGFFCGFLVQSILTFIVVDSLTHAQHYPVNKMHVMEDKTFKLIRKEKRNNTALKSISH